MTVDNHTIQEVVETWLYEVVIGLQLCPFAKAPAQKNQIRIVISNASTEEALNEELIKECQFLDNNKDTETSLLVCPQMLNDFFDFCQFLYWAQSTLKSNDWQGIYQLAHFHPHYCFSNCEPKDPQNLTNRSPYPILHILRESSLTKVLEKFENSDSIPERNIQTMNNLNQKQIKQYFYYLQNLS